MTLIRKLKYTWPVVAGCFLLILLYFFKSFVGQYVILYGLAILILVPILEVVIQGKNGFSYALIGLFLGLAFGLVFGSYTGEYISQIIFDASIQEVKTRPELVIWNVFVVSILASVFTILGGKVGRNNNEPSNFYLSIIGTTIVLVSVTLFSDYPLIKAIGTIFGMYLVVKGQVELSKKHPYLFKQPWEKR